MAVRTELNLDDEPGKLLAAVCLSNSGGSMAKWPEHQIKEIPSTQSNIGLVYKQTSVVKLSDRPDHLYKRRFLFSLCCFDVVVSVAR